MAIHNDPLSKLYKESIYDIGLGMENKVIQAVAKILKDKDIDPTQFKDAVQLRNAFYKLVQDQTGTSAEYGIHIETKMGRILDDVLDPTKDIYTQAIDAFVYDLKPVFEDRVEFILSKRKINQQKYMKAFQNWKESYKAIQQANKDSGINTDF